MEKDRVTIDLVAKDPVTKQNTGHHADMHTVLTELELNYASNRGNKTVP